MASGGYWQLEKSLRDTNRHMLDTGLGADVCFRVGPQTESGGGVEMRAHKFMLVSRSPVFETMFYGNLPESSDVIRLPDVTPQAFSNLLEYMYTESCQLDDLDTALHTVYAAKKYMVPGLTHLAVRHLDDTMASGHVCHVLEQAAMLDEGGLVASCMAFIQSNAGAVVKEESFTLLSEPILRMILQDGGLMIQEADLLTGLICWARHQCQPERDLQNSSQNTEDDSIANHPDVRQGSIEDFQSVENVQSNQSAVDADSSNANSSGGNSQDNDNSPNHGENENSPNNGDNENSPNNGENENSPNNGENENSPNNGDNQNSPNNGEEAESLSIGNQNESNELCGLDNMRPSYTGAYSGAMVPEENSQLSHNSANETNRRSQETDNDRTDQSHPQSNAQSHDKSQEMMKARLDSLLSLTRLPLVPWQRLLRINHGVRILSENQLQDILLYQTGILPASALPYSCSLRGCHKWVRFRIKKDFTTSSLVRKQETVRCKATFEVRAISETPVTILALTLLCGPYFIRISVFDTEGQMISYTERDFTEMPEVECCREMTIVLSEPVQCSLTDDFTRIEVYLSKSETMFWYDNIIVAKFASGKPFKVRHTTPEVISKIHYLSAPY